MNDVVLALIALLAPPADAVRARAEAALAPLVESGAARSVVVGLLRNGERAVLGFGCARAGDPAAPDAGTVYEIGSVSKVFTGLLLADAVERGVATLDDPIQAHLPADVVVPTDEPSIRLRHLVTHTSGLPRLPENLPMTNPLDPYADYGVDDLRSYLRDYVLESTPGERYGYSNLGMGLLGQLLAETQQVPGYEPLLVLRIAGPLRLESTRVTPTAEMTARLADPIEVGDLPPIRWSFDALAGCGGIRSCADDLLDFAEAQLDPADTPLAGAIERSQERLHPLGDAEGGVAYGWHLNGDGRMLWHNGQTGGFHAWLSVDRSAGNAVVILATSSAGDVIDRLGSELTAALRPDAETQK